MTGARQIRPLYSVFMTRGTEPGRRSEYRLQSAVPRWGEDFYYFSRFMVSCPVTSFPNLLPSLPPPADPPELQLKEDSDLVKIGTSTSYKGQDEGLGKI